MNTYHSFIIWELQLKHYHTKILSQDFPPPFFTRGYQAVENVFSVLWFFYWLQARKVMKVWPLDSQSLAALPPPPLKKIRYFQLVEKSTLFFFSFFTVKPIVISVFYYWIPPWKFCFFHYWMIPHTIWFCHVHDVFLKVFNGFILIAFSVYFL